jgi:hypothetical protein
MKWIVACFLLLTANVAKADALPSLEDVRNLTNRAMEKAVDGDYEGGFALLRQYFIGPDVKFDAALTPIGPQTAMIKQAYGKCLGHEPVSEKTAGQSLVLMTQLQKFENAALRWEFVFYNNSKGWLLYGFHFDEKIVDLFSN